MVGSNMLLEIHKRLQQLKGVTADVTFGGVSILAVGDLYQLPPVGQPLLFSDSYAQLYKSGSLWVDEFEMLELSEIMRQHGDSAFAELLCRVKTATCTTHDIDILKSREITVDLPDYPNSALHVYRLNSDFDTRNALMLNNLVPLVAKLADIEQDMCLKAADILCFCETWLTASQASPNILNHQVAARCDRMTGDNKGGAMIYSDMQICNTCPFTSPGIEVACTTVTLPNADQMQICLNY